MAQFIVVLNRLPQNFERYGLDQRNGTLATVILVAVNYLHIPTFMFVAGSVLAMRDDSALGGYGRFAKRKFCRLMLPFFAVSIMTLAIKLVSPDRGLSEVPAELLGMTVAPKSGAAA